MFGAKIVKVRNGYFSSMYILTFMLTSLMQKHFIKIPLIVEENGKKYEIFNARKC